MVRRIRTAKPIGDGSAQCGAPIPEVTFDALPNAADAAWYRRHLSLFKWNGTTGEMAFEAGFPADPVTSTAVDRGPILDRDGDPVALAKLTGQSRVVNAFMTALEAAKVRGNPLPHALLLGEAGLGKSTIARAVANAMGRAVAMTSGPLIADAAALIRLLTSLESGQVLFIDEIHALPRRVAEVLYEAMEDRVLRLPVTDGRRSKTIDIGLNPFTLIGATTEIGRVAAALQSRFTIREYLDLYTDAELSEIVKQSVGRDGLGIDPDAAARIARLARGVPRDAIKFALRVQDRALARKAARIDVGFVDAALAESGIDERGLGPIERRALGALLRHGRGRAMGLTRWAAASGVGPSVLRHLCEPVLIRQGLMTVTPRGRMALEASGRVAVA
jgi:Holliday junction DNA helicase RuvB